MEDAFKARERALENRFFREVDKALVERLREGMASEDCREKLRDATGISDARLLDDLMTAGIQPTTLIAFLLLPLAQVAWADGKVDQQERQIVLDTAIALGCSAESDTLELLAHWLEQAPDDELFQIWRDVASHITNHLSGFSRQELADTIVRRSRAVAEATGGIFGSGRVSAAENKVIKQIQTAIPATAKEIR